MPLVAASAIGRGFASRLRAIIRSSFGAISRLNHTSLRGPVISDQGAADMSSRMPMRRSSPAWSASIRSWSHRFSHRSQQMQADISVIRARDVLVGARTKLINTARGLVKSLGGRLPRCTTPYFAQRVREQTPEEFEPILAPLATAIESFTEQIRNYERHIEELANQHYPKTVVLRQVAGVGALTSLAFVLTLFDRRRFARSRDVGPYLGLVPRQDRSGEHRPQLPITKAGNGYLRRLLIGSAHYIFAPFGPDSDLRRFGIGMAERGSKNAKKRRRGGT
jgi:transposase